MAAMRCVDEGIAPETVDEAALAFGMPMGPIELADTVGLDICVAVGKLLGTDVAPPARLMELVAAGHLGKKTGRGFYTWDGGKAQKQPAAAVPAGLAERLVGPFVAEAKAALAEHIVADADLVDAGAIFGTGFAPFRGGPLHYADSAQVEARAVVAGSLYPHASGVRFSRGGGVLTHGPAPSVAAIARILPGSRPTTDRRHSAGARHGRSVVEKIWLTSYPAGVPAEIDVNEYASVCAVFEESVARSTRTAPRLRAWASRSRSPSSTAVGAGSARGCRARGSPRARAWRS